MNAQNTEKKPVIKRETKNKIRVEFERTPFKQRFKEKFLSFNFLQQVVGKLFWYLLMIGVAYIILEPFISQILGSVMAPKDFVDSTVNMIPRNFSLDIYKGLLTETDFMRYFGNTFLLSFSTALIQMFVCCFIGYGFAKFKFRGRNLIFMLVMLTMIVPHNTIRLAIQTKFINFDILGIVRLLNGGGIEFFGWNIMDLGDGVASFFKALDIIPFDSIPLGVTETGEQIAIGISENGLNLSATYAPMIILSICGLAFKNGLYIFLLRQFFRGIPDELEESAYIDGCGTFHTFFRIILPLSIPMMVTVFLFAFCWQWTDNFYTIKIFNMENINPTQQVFGNFYQKMSGAATNLPPSLQNVEPMKAQAAYNIAVRNTSCLLIIAPLIVLYAFCQNFLVQGIEHSGIAN